MTGPLQIVLGTLAVLLLVVSVVYATKAVRAMLRIFRTGQPDPTRSGDVGPRVKTLAVESLGHTRMLKWSAIGDFAGEGFAVYDMWGLATGGIRQFKEGFGGEEIEYVGARDLALRAPMDAALRVAIPAYGLAQRARLRLLGRDAGEAAAPDVA